MPNDPTKQQFDVVDPRSPSGAPGESTSGLMISAGKHPTEVGNVRDSRETSASLIAQIITWTFAVCSVLLLLGTFLVLFVRPDQAKMLLGEAGLPALKEGGSFLSSVFGPLLAFVLGYYFGERKSKQN